MSGLLQASLDDGAPTEGYPFGLPAVRDVDRIEFGAVTVLSGDNGSGKSTIVEAIAVAAGFNAEGGNRNLRFATADTHSPLHDHLVLRWRGRHHRGWFLRAESFYAMASHIGADRDLQAVFPDLHGASHGESFLDLALARFLQPGLYVLDEPEAALSIQGQMALARVIAASVGSGGQFVIATHSPFLLAYPGAALYELGPDGVARTTFDDLAATNLWRRFHQDPPTFYARLLSD
ncbi:MAG: AAA family ATPase [Acidimicrobiia bacterium]